MNVEELFEKLRPILGRQLEPLWLEYQLNPQRRSELEGFLRLLAAKNLGRPDEQPVLLEPPPPEQAEGEYPLGTVLYGDRDRGPFALRQPEWIQHVGIFGRTGSGKTNVGFLLAKALVDRGVPVLVFDWKRNYRDLLQIVPGFSVHTVGRDVAPFAFNPLTPPPGTQPSVWLKKLIEIVCHVYWLGEGVAYLLQKALHAAYQSAGVFDGSQRYPTLADVRDWLASAKVKGREAQWMDSTRRAIETLCYGDIGAVVNAHNPPNPGELLKRNVILELDALTNSDKTFLTEVLLLWIHHYRLHAPDREHLKHAIIIEEAHHVLLRRKQSKETVTDIILREIRELGESITLIDQHPSLISVPSLGNTYTTIAMNLKHGSDVNTLASAMLLGEEEKGCLGRLPVGQGIVRLQGRWFKPFLVRFPLLGVEKGKVTDQDLIARSAGCSVSAPVIRAEQRGKEEIRPVRAAAKLNGEGIELLRDVMENMTSGVAERYKRLGLSSYLGNKISESLVAKGLVEPVDISTGNGRVRLLWLTAVGAEALRGLGVDGAARARGGPEHEYWKERVAKHLREQGYAVEVEKPIGGGKTIDLVAGRDCIATAIEIETGASDVAANVVKCVAAGYERVVVLATRKSELHKIAGFAKYASRGSDIVVQDVMSFLTEQRYSL